MGILFISMCVTLNEFLKLGISRVNKYIIRKEYTFSEILDIKNLAECLAYGRNLNIINYQ